MDTLANQPQPPAFDRIREAFATALELPEWKPTTIRVGVCRGDGELVAAGVLNDRRQARLFAIQMADLGYRELDGGAAAEKGFDTVYVPDYLVH